MQASNLDSPVFHYVGTARWKYKVYRYQGRNNLGNILHADDLAMVVDNKEELQKASESEQLCTLDRYSA